MSHATSHAYDSLEILENPFYHSTLLTLGENMFALQYVAILLA